MDIILYFCNWRINLEYLYLHWKKIVHRGILPFLISWYLYISYWRLVVFWYSFVFWFFFLGWFVSILCWGWSRGCWVLGVLHLRFFFGCGWGNRQFFFSSFWRVGIFFLESCSIFSFNRYYHWNSHWFDYWYNRWGRCIFGWRCVEVWWRCF